MLSNYFANQEKSAQQNLGYVLIVGKSVLKLYNEGE